MPNYAVDSSRQPMIATGVVGVVQEWEDKPGGGRRPSDRQARDEGTGMPLWQVEVLYQQTAYGRVSSVTAMVAVGAPEQPVVPTLGLVSFTGLRAEVRTTKAGGLVESWTAEALNPATGTTGSAGAAGSSRGSRASSGDAA
ncbi:MAG: hypothetical protein ACRC35_05625 [Angustibacter sp.]